MAQTLSLVNDKCVSISTIGEVGVSSIDSYSEDIDGVGVVNRTFAISKNGIHFSKSTWLLCDWHAPGSIFANPLDDSFQYRSLASISES